MKLMNKAILILILSTNFAAIINACDGDSVEQKISSDIKDQLHDAIKKGNVEKVKDLLKNNKNIDFLSLDYSRFTKAIINENNSDNNEEITELFLNNIPNINATTDSGKPSVLNNIIEAIEHQIMNRSYSFYGDKKKLNDETEILDSKIFNILNTLIGLGLNLNITGHESESNNDLQKIIRVHTLDEGKLELNKTGQLVNDWFKYYSDYKKDEKAGFPKLINVLKMHGLVQEQTGMHTDVIGLICQYADFEDWVKWVKPETEVSTTQTMSQPSSSSSSSK